MPVTNKRPKLDDKFFARLLAEQARIGERSPRPNVELAEKYGVPVATMRRWVMLARAAVPGMHPGKGRRPWVNHCPTCGASPSRQTKRPAR